MNMRVQKSPLIGFLLCVIIGGMSLHAQDEYYVKEIYVPSGRSSALGGPHAALTDDFSAIFHNPAGFNVPEAQLSVAEITTHLGGPIFDIASVIVQAVGGGSPESLLASSEVQSLLKGLYASANVLGPISFGYVGNGLGFGFFNQSKATFENSSPLTITSKVSEQLILCGGYSFRIPFSEETKSTLDLGLLLKGSLRGELLLKKSFLEFPQLFSNISPDLLLQQPFRFITAIGFDVGILYSYDEVFRVGLVGRDIFTPTMRSNYTTAKGFFDGEDAVSTVNGIVPLDLSFGIIFDPKLGALENVVSDFKVMLDYNDILDFLLYPATATHPLLHIGVGVEAQFLKILSIRAGFYQGYFNAGLGMDLHIFTLNASMFGRELSSEPGLRPVYNLMIGLEFRF